MQALRTEVGELREENAALRARVAELEREAQSRPSGGKVLKVESVHTGPSEEAQRVGELLSYCRATVSFVQAPLTGQVRPVCVCLLWCPCSCIDCA